MTLIHKLLVPAAVLLSSAALPTMAGSLAGSSAAGGSSASSAGSASSEKSSEGSSNSSSKTNTVAEGPYKIIDVAALPDRPGTLRVTLQALAEPGAGGELFLDVPQSIFEQHGLAAGQTIVAKERPYGTEFAHADTRQAFFLLMSDAWTRELAPHPVVL